MQLLARTPPLPSSSSIVSGGRWVSSSRDIDPYSVDIVRGLPALSTFNEKGFPNFLASPMSSPPRPAIHNQHHHHHHQQQQQHPHQHQQPHHHHQHSRELSGQGRPLSQSHVLANGLNDPSRQPRNVVGQPHGLSSLEADRRLPPFSHADARLGPLPSQPPTADGMGHTPFLVPRSIASPQGARRTKSHVASACVNCKKAHLACDVRRPCPRCVGLGKQDSCKDVQHKKRGRPRLREERHSFEVANHHLPHHERHDQGGPDPRMNAGHGVPPPAGRARGNSASQGSRIVPYGMPGHMPPRYDAPPRPYYDDRAPPPRPSVAAPPLSSGMVLLSIDFVVARSTEGLQDMLGFAAHELNRVKSLYDLVYLPDRKKLYQLATKLKESVNESDPAYVSSVSNSPAYYDYVYNISPGEVMDATRHFREIDEIIELKRSDGRTVRTNARMSIGKGREYFVVLVLSVVLDSGSPLQYRNSPSSPYPSHTSKASSNYAPSPSLHSLSPSLSTPQYVGQQPPPIAQQQQQQQHQQHPPPPPPPRPYTSHSDVAPGGSPYHMYPPLQPINSAGGNTGSGDSRQMTPRALQADPPLPPLRQFTATSPATSVGSGPIIPRSPPRRSPTHEPSPVVGTPYEQQSVQEPLKLPPLRGLPGASPTNQVPPNQSPRESETRGLGIRIPEPLSANSSAQGTSLKRPSDHDSQDGEPSGKRRRIGVAEMLD